MGATNTASPAKGVPEQPLELHAVSTPLLTRKQAQTPQFARVLLLASSETSLVVGLSVVVTGRPEVARFHESRARRCGTPRTDPETRRYREQVCARHPAQTRFARIRGLGDRGCIRRTNVVVLAGRTAVSKHPNVESGSLGDSTRHPVRAKRDSEHGAFGRRSGIGTAPSRRDARTHEQPPSAPPVTIALLGTTPRPARSSRREAVGECDVGEKWPSVGRNDGRGWGESWPPTAVCGLSGRADGPVAVELEQVVRRGN